MFESYGILFFRIVNHISISLMIFMLSSTFTHILFSLRILLLAVEYLIGRLFDRKPDKLLARTLYRIHVTAHAILKVREEDAMNDALFAPLSNSRGRQRESPYQTKRYHALKLSRRIQSSRIGSHEETGWCLATLTRVKYV